jgi:choice-of-anchor C domain-containing protein
MQKSLTIAGLALGLFALDAQNLTQAAGPNLITDGSFEVACSPPFDTVPPGSIGGWAVATPSVDLICGYWPAQDGTRSLDMTGSAQGVVTQTFATVKGGKYKLKFWLSGNPDPLCDGTGNAEDKLAFTRRLQVSLVDSSTNQTLKSEEEDWNVIEEGNTLTDMLWESEKLKFKAKGASTTLIFESLTGQFCGTAIDNVSVVRADDDDDDNDKNDKKKGNKK